MTRKQLYGGGACTFVSAALAALAVAVLAIGGSGCPRNPDPGTTPLIDLAVGDSGLGFSDKGDSVEDAFASAKVLLYFDVLNGDSQQTPDVVLDGADIGSIAHPISTVLTEHDLYVADDAWGVVNIWREYRTLDAKVVTPNSPDVVLSGNGTINNPQQILVEDNRLFVADTSVSPPKVCCGGVHVFDDAAGITEDRTADLLLDDASAPTGIAYADNQLYVADAEYDRVLVYTDISGRLADKGVDSDLIELSGPSWLNLDNNGPIIPLKVDVFDNVLYVTTETNFLFVFSPADALENQQPPDAVIAESNGALNTPYGSQKVGNRLYVGNLNAPAFGVPVKSADAKASTIGLAGFDDADNLVIGQQPAVTFDSSNAQVPAVRDLAAEEHVLFVATAVPDSSFFFPFKDTPLLPYYFFGSFYAVGDVHIYRNAGGLIHGSPGDIVLPALKDFFGPISIDTNRRFPGLP